MNSKRLLSFVLASASALSSSLAAKRNFNNNLLGGQYKTSKASGNRRLRKKIRKADASKTRLNSDKIVLKSMKRNGTGIENYVKKEQKKRDIKIDPQKVVNPSPEKSFQVNAESLKKNTVDSSKSFNDKLLLGGEIALGSLAGLGLVGWGAFEAYCKRDFNRSTYSLSLDDNYIYDLKQEFKNTKGYVLNLHTYFCFLHDSNHSYVACSSYEEALKKFLEYKLGLSPSSEVEVKNVDIKNAAKHLVFYLRPVEKSVPFIKRKVENSVKRMVCAKIIDLFEAQEKIIFRSLSSGLKVADKIEEEIKVDAGENNGSYYECKCMMFKL